MCYTLAVPCTNTEWISEVAGNNVKKLAGHVCKIWLSELFKLQKVMIAQRRKSFGHATEVSRHPAKRVRQTSQNTSLFGTSMFRLSSLHLSLCLSNHQWDSANHSSANGGPPEVALTTRHSWCGCCPIAPSPHSDWHSLIALKQKGRVFVQAASLHKGWTSNEFIRFPDVVRFLKNIYMVQLFSKTRSSGMGVGTTLSWLPLCSSTSRSINAAWVKPAGPLVC